jgi:hypothetical protein
MQLVKLAIATLTKSWRVLLNRGPLQYGCDKSGHSHLIVVACRIWPPSPRKDGEMAMRNRNQPQSRYEVAPVLNAPHPAGIDAAFGMRAAGLVAKRVA